ncbi:tetratricopeptide repeat protein [Haliangium ochraceum]|uniref:tetratricopeptide repeat protein n=1 Tax=Haliangium ochraceum TaxID=80816 RepID=UPI00019B94B3|nr:tetratricopeptide repeat protein [Haliangium ochraceum]
MGALAAVLLGLLLAAPQAAQAQAADNELAARRAAKPLFEEGRTLMDQGDFRAAADKLQQAQDTFPAVGTLLNLGVCRRELGETIAAWEAFREAAELAERTKDERVDYARERMRELRPMLFLLVVEVPEEVRSDDLEVTHKGESIPPERWGQPFPVEFGDNLVRATRPGYEPFSTEVALAGRGKETTVSIPALSEASAEPEPVASAVDLSASGERDGGGMPSGRKIALTSAALGVVGLTVGTIFGVRAGSQYDQAEDICSIDGVAMCEDFERDESQALRDDARGSATIATVSMSLGVVAAAAGAVLWFMNPGDGASSTESAHFAPLLAPGTAGLSVRVGF